MRRPYIPKYPIFEVDKLDPSTDLPSSPLTEEERAEFFEACHRIMEALDDMKREMDNGKDSRNN